MLNNKINNKIITIKAIKSKNKSKITNKTRIKIIRTRIKTKIKVIITKIPVKVKRKQR